MTKTAQRKMLKDFSKEDLLQMALNEPGTISNCYSLFYNYSANNAWFLALQQADRGLDITPVMSSTAWVKNGYITEETRRKMSKIWAMVPQTITLDKVDRNGNKVKNEKGEVEKVSFTKFPFRQAFISYSMIKKKDLLKEFKQEFTFDKEETLSRLGLTEIPYNNIDGNCQGYCMPFKKVVAINPLAENAQKTLLHEIAHCILHVSDEQFVDTTNIDRTIKEAEAESTAYICSIMLGDENEEHLSNSRAYIQHWLKAGKGVESFTKYNVNRVMKAVDIIMKAVANNKGKYNEAELAKDLKALKEIKRED